MRAGETAVVVDLWPSASSAPYARLAVTAPEPDPELVRTVRERLGRERVRSV
ncbi:hypothetical protein N4P33_11520 [Streptomyces sp. 15-116A]|nr:hypothetical protein [Streptomyces sp. 15-116A]